MISCRKRNFLSDISAVKQPVHHIKSSEALRLMWRATDTVLLYNDRDQSERWWQIRNSGLKGTRKHIYMLAWNDLSHRRSEAGPSESNLCICYDWLTGLLIFDRIVSINCPLTTLFFVCFLCFHLFPHLSCELNLETARYCLFKWFFKRSHWCGSYCM